MTTATQAICWNEWLSAWAPHLVGSVVNTTSTWTALKGGVMPLCWTASTTSSARHLTCTASTTKHVEPCAPTIKRHVEATCSVEQPLSKN